MNIKLTRAPEPFYILAPSDDSKVLVKILGGTRFIAPVELMSPLLLAPAYVFKNKLKAHYPVTHNQIKTFTASSVDQQVSIDNACLGPIPERTLIVLVKNTSFVGFGSTNLFHYHHYHMTNLGLYVNGFSTLPNHSLWIALNPLVLPGLTKHCFRVRLFITMNVLT